MTLHSLEVGFVSADAGLVAFYETVLELTALEPLVFPVGTLHRLEIPGGLLKVLVPAEEPATAPDTGAFTDTRGLRYITVRVTDLDGVLARATEHGGTTVLEPIDVGGGSRLAIVRDPDGNTFEVSQPAG
jgi:catechol 2,3-dioxygenase-like lactoylglutathione lyase family enzyme